MPRSLPKVIPIQKITRGSQPDTYRLFKRIKETMTKKPKSASGQLPGVKLEVA